MNESAVSFNYKRNNNGYFDDYDDDDDGRSQLSPAPT